MNLLTHLPELESGELLQLETVLHGMDDPQIQQFASAYRARRKDPQTTLLLTLLGFVCVAGVQRFVLDQIGMGLLYLLTGGFCSIGTIYDLFNYKRLTREYNLKEARRIAAVIGMTKPF